MYDVDSVPFLIVDPKLPKDFDNTPNESRTKKEVEMWWDRPYAITRPDGKLEVRCLDGGAHDRSSHYGFANNIAEAAVLAWKKLNQWKQRRNMLVIVSEHDTKHIVVSLPIKPFDQAIEIATFETKELASKALLELA